MFVSMCVYIYIYIYTYQGKTHIVPTTRLTGTVLTNMHDSRRILS